MTDDVTPIALAARRVCRAAVTAVTLGALWAPSAHATLLPPAGPWPAPVSGATNPLLGTAFIFNGAHATANADPRVWLTSGGRRRFAITRTIGRRAVVRGRLRDRTRRRSIGGATLLLAAQNVEGGGWYVAGAARTNRHGVFKGVLPPGPTRRVGVLYWPFVSSPTPVFSRRLLVRASARVWLKTTTTGRSVLFEGKVSGGSIPPGGLLIGAQVKNGPFWVTVRLVRTGPSGRFRARYRFKFRRRSYAVRAIAPAQPAWPLYSGNSRTQRVHTR